MESLSPECTPLKHRYDSCFNAWFEGYLQPALDSAPPSSVPSSPRPFASPSPSSSSDDVSTSVPAQAGPSSTKRRLITSWSSAFPPARRPTPLAAPGPRSTSDDGDGGDGSAVEAVPVAVTEGPLDTRGKTRAQIKAEQYERACGAVWREYQGCLKRAIAQNTSLSTLLEQARSEHPLHSQTGLEGTAWDRNGVAGTNGS